MRKVAHIYGRINEWVNIRHSKAVRRRITLKILKTAGASERRT